MGKKTNRIYYVKSDWIPQFQPSVALEGYLEEVIWRKLQLAEIRPSQQKCNLSLEERKALQS